MPQEIEQVDNSGSLREILKRAYMASLQEMADSSLSFEDRTPKSRLEDEPHVIIVMQLIDQIPLVYKAR